MIKKVRSIAISAGAGLVMLTAVLVIGNRDGVIDRVLHEFGLPSVSEILAFDGLGRAEGAPEVDLGAEDRDPGDSGADDPTVVPDGDLDDIGIDHLEALEVVRKDVNANSLSGDYDRARDFGSGWLDPDGNGCDARNDILARDLTDAQIDSDGCTVLSGSLDDPYTGETIDFERGPRSSEVQVDHIVALAHAYDAGADEWTQEKRIAFANDPINLLASDGPANMSKGAKGAHEWLVPDNPSYQCTYARAQVNVKTVYELPVGPQERKALARALETC